MGAVADAVLIVVSYLVGTIPTALWVARAAGHDPTLEGSRNPGASNVYRIAGFRAGLVVFVGDVAKGMAATGAGYAVGGRELAAACGLAAVVGHVFPVFRRFRGGRGVATAAGMMIVMFPFVTAAALAVWLVLVRVTGKASIGSLAVALGFPPAVALVGRPGWEVAAVGAATCLILFRHTDNLIRLLRGQERSMQVGDAESR